MYKILLKGHNTIIVESVNINKIFKEVITMILGASLVISGLVGFGYSVMQIVNIGSTLF